MNILEKLQFYVKDVGVVKNQMELKIFVAGYLAGLDDQRKEDFCQLTAEDYEVITRWMDTALQNPFYFTFGSWEQFPYHNTYMIVYADTIQEAVRKFKAKYPNRQDSSVLNCSSYYTREEWQKILNEGYYRGVQPCEIME